MPEVYQSNKRYHAFCLDMDGTLLNSQHEISEGNLRALHKLSHDLIIIPTSGRARLSTEQVFEHMFERYKTRHLSKGYNFDIPIIIAFNGALVYRNGNLIVEKPIKGNAVDDIQRTVQEKLPDSIVLVRYSYDNAFAKVTDSNHARFSRYEKRNTHVRFERLNSFQTGGNPPKFIVLANNRRELKPLLDELTERYGNELYITWTGSDDEPQLEIMSSGVGKLEAVRRLLAYENRLPVAEKIIRQSSEPVTLDHIVTMGDNDNDCELMAASGLRIAPKNASRKVRSIAGLLTTESDNDGNCVAEAVDEYITPLLFGRRNGRRWANLVAFL